MKRKMLSTRLAILGALLAPPIHADDSSTGVPLLGLESDPADTVFPHACSVTMTAGKVTVELTVGTGTASPALLLNGPVFGWGGASEPYPDRQFPELEIRIDGSPVTPDDGFEAFAGKTNITNFIKTAQLDPWAITRTPPVTAAHTKYPQVLKGLKNLSAIESCGDDTYLAKWTARRLISIPVKAVPDQRISLSYAARPAYSTVTSDQVVTETREKLYCISAKHLGAVLRSGSAPRPVIITEYIIATGIDGKPPTTVTLTTSMNGPGLPRAYLFACAPQGKSIAVTSNLARQPVQVDSSARLQLLKITDAAPKSPYSSRAIPAP